MAKVRKLFSFVWDGISACSGNKSRKYEICSLCAAVFYPGYLLYFCRRNMVGAKLLRFVRYFLLVLFVGYCSEIVAFLHVHIVNGVTVVHSHPSSHKETHQHSYVELQLYHVISRISIDDCEVSSLELPFFLTFLRSLDVIFSEGTGLTDIERYISLRAPPFIAGLY